jgi:hypothetical protein
LLGRTVGARARVAAGRWLGRPGLPVRRRFPFFFSFVFSYLTILRTVLVLDL